MLLTKKRMTLLISILCCWWLAGPVASSQETQPADTDRTEQQADQGEQDRESDEATSDKEDPDRDESSAEENPSDDEGNDEPTNEKENSEEAAADSENDAGDVKARFHREGYRGELILRRGATDWKYFDGKDEPKNWVTEDFDDSQWKSGTAPLGYGENDLATEFSYGDDEQNKHPIAWLRRELEIDDATKYDIIEAHVRADDGATFYVNGKQANQLNVVPTVYRQSEYAGIQPSEESEYKRVLISSRLLREGKNTLAVSVHQRAPTSSDLVLDMDMWGLNAEEARQSRQSDLFQVESPTEVYYNDASFQRYAGFYGSQWAVTENLPTVRRLLRRVRKNRPTEIELLAAKTEPQTPAEIYHNARPSVLAFFHVSKDSPRVVSMGSGVIISKSGAAITNFHVLANPGRPGSRALTNVAKEVLVAVNMDGTFYPVTKILAGSTDDDAAVVQLGGENFEASPLVAGKAVGTPVNVVSCPHFQMFQLTTGTVTRYLVAGNRKIMSISAGIGGGSSGGPVFDDCGNVVGITVAVRALTRDGISLKPDEKTGFLKVDNKSTSNLQLNRMHEMTVNLCVPARSVLKLISD